MPGPLPAPRFRPTRLGTWLLDGSCEPQRSSLHSPARHRSVLGRLQQRRERRRPCAHHGSRWPRLIFDDSAYRHLRDRRAALPEHIDLILATVALPDYRAPDRERTRAVLRSEHPRSRTLAEGRRRLQWRAWTDRGRLRPVPRPASEIMRVTIAGTTSQTIRTTIAAMCSTSTSKGIRMRVASECPRESQGSRD